MKITTLPLLLLLASSPALAEQSPGDPSPTVAEDPGPATPPATEERASAPRTAAAGDIEYRLIGYLRLEGAVVTNDPEVEFVGRNDGFRLQNARVGIAGSWRERVRIRLSADGAIDEREDPNEVEGTLRFALEDAYVDLVAARQAELRIARFKIHFDIEQVTSPSRRAFIDRALSSRGVFATEGFETSGLGVDRSLGIALRSEALLAAGSFALGYEIAAQNGNDSSDAANDNDSLAYSAALFAAAGGASVWAGGRYNRRTEGELPFRRTEDDYEAAVGARVIAAPVRATAQLLYRRTDFATTGGPAQNAFGVHAEAMVAIPGIDMVEVGYRYSILEPSDLIPSDRVQEHTAGANLALPRWRSALQLNVTHTVEQAGRELDNDRIEALFQLSL
jgi:hypothetical protein